MKLRVVLAAAALVFGTSREAFAGVIPGGPPTFTVDVTSNVGGDALHLAPTLTQGQNGNYSTSGQEAAPSFSILFDFALNTDPAVSGSFTLTNLSGTTQTFTVAATLSGLLPIVGPTRIGGSFGDATYTDANGDESVEISSAAFYRAMIDGGGVHDLGLFDQMASGGPGIFGTISREEFGKPIPNDVGPAVAGSIGVSFPGFSLTPGDSVQVPFEFVVAVPEPVFAPIFAIGVTLIIRRIAREKASRRSGRSGRILPTGG
jgi:hypothetical protein